ncbi:MAG: hypothetical protein ACYCZX_05705 [Rhodospirillaceae bacterium]
MPYDAIPKRPLKRNDFSDAHDTVAGRPFRNLGALQTSELFVLSAIRLWCDTDQRPCRRALLRGGFHAVDLGCAAYALFDQAMSTVTAGAKRPFTTAFACRAPLMHDEAWLLECLALIQHHRSSETAELLSALLPAAAVRAAAEALDSLGCALAGVGLHLRIRSLDATREIRAAHLWRHALSRGVH